MLRKIGTSASGLVSSSAEIIVAQMVAVVDLAIIGRRPADAEIVDRPGERTARTIFEAAVLKVAGEIIGDDAVKASEALLLLQYVRPVIAQVEPAGNAERVVEAEAIVERDVDPGGVEARKICLVAGPAKRSGRSRDCG